MGRSPPVGFGMSATSTCSKSSGKTPSASRRARRSHSTSRTSSPKSATWRGCQPSGVAVRRLKRFPAARSCAACRRGGSGPLHSASGTSSSALPPSIACQSAPQRTRSWASTRLGAVVGVPSASASPCCHPTGARERACAPEAWPSNIRQMKSGQSNLRRCHSWGTMAWPAAVPASPQARKRAAPPAAQGGPRRERCAARWLGQPRGQSRPPSARARGSRRACGGARTPHPTALPKRKGATPGPLPRAPGRRRSAGRARLTSGGPSRGWAAATPSCAGRPPPCAGPAAAPRRPGQGPRHPCRRGGPTPRGEGPAPLGRQ